MRSPFRLPKCSIPLYLPVYNGQQIGKLQYVCSTAEGKMNVSEIVKSTFSWQSNGGTTNVEQTPHPVEFKENLYIYIYIYIYSGHPFFKGDSYK